MDLSKENEQRKEFRSILLDLSSNQKMLQDANIRYEIYRRLEALYYAPEGSDCFRHFYSDIFMVLTEIKNKNSDNDINILGQNLSVLRKEYQVKNTDKNGNNIDISSQLRKLEDHVNLDIARILYSDSEDIKISGGTALNDIKNKIAQIQDQNDAVKDKVEKQQREYVAILGIFATIVVTVHGGISFSVSAFSSIGKANSYEMTIIALAIGMILLNLLSALFYYIEKIVHRETRLTLLNYANIAIVIVICIMGFCLKSTPCSP